MRRFAAVLLLASSLAGCTNVTATKPNELTVLAASSLTGVFTELQSQFEATHPGVKVKLVLDSSATLSQMVEQGAPGDVLATADQRTMDHTRIAGGIVGQADQFATNTMVLIVPANNPANIKSLGGLSAKTDFVVCVPTAPCGAAAAALLTTNHVSAQPASEETDVKAVLNKVVTGEANAGLVFTTDALSAGDKVRQIAIPGASQAPNTYWIAQTKQAEVSSLAQDWIDLVLGPNGQAVLARAGFATQ